MGLAAPLIAQAAETFAQNWPNFRGPVFNGTSATANPPLTWSETENVKWKTELPGAGDNSSPIVWGDRVFVLAAIPSQASDARPAAEARSRQGRGGRGGGRPPVPLAPTAFVTLCYDRQSGAELWRQTAVETIPHQATHPDHGFASASPCTDGNFVWSHFGSRGLYCYDMDGNRVWKRDDFGQMETRNGFGEGSSPLLHGDTIVVPWDHEGQSFVIALDAATGETRWRKDRDEPSNWVTPVVVEDDGRAILVTGGERLARGYDLETGEELWHSSGFTSRPIASPVVFGDTVILASARQGFFVSAMRVSGSGDLNARDGVVWSSRVVAPDVPSLLLSDDRVYFMRGSTNVLNCWDAATGKPRYDPQRLDGLSAVYASPVAANGRVIIVGRDGIAIVLADGDSFEVVATNRLEDRIDATPALVDGEIFLRGKTYLYCVAEQ